MIMLNCSMWAMDIPDKINSTYLAVMPDNTPLSFPVPSDQDMQDDSLNCVICFENLFEKTDVPYRDADTGNERLKKVLIDDLVMLRCGHQFHQKCLRGHLEYKRKCTKVYENAGMQSSCVDDCPMCRDPLNANIQLGEQKGDRLYDSVVVVASDEPAGEFCIPFISLFKMFQCPPTPNQEEV